VNALARTFDTLRGQASFSRASLIAVSVVGIGVTVFLYLGFPILLLPGILGLILVGLVTLLSPTLGLGLVVASQYVPVDLGEITLLQLLGTYVSAVAIVSCIARKRGFVLSNLIPPMVAIVLLAVASYSYTRNPEVITWSLRRLAFNIILCGLLVNVINTVAHLRVPLWTFVGMAFVNSLVALFQFATGAMREERTRGLLENENQFGEVAGVAFVLPFYLFLRAEKPWKRAAGLGISIILAAGMATSVSRGAILSWLAGLLMILLRERRYWLRVVVFAGLTLMLVPFLPENFFRRFETIGLELKGTVMLDERHGLSTRGYFNKAGIEIWKAHPVLGVGFGSYGYYFIQPEFNPGLKASRRIVAHNLYVQVLAELGIVGFLALLWWIFEAGRNYVLAERSGAQGEMLVYLRSCEVMTAVTLIAYAASGSLLGSHLTIILALSYICRRCVQAAQEPGAPTTRPAGAGA
jgi:O-antigen ligase